MYLKTSNKKQLAAAVTLAVMGMAWVAVPSQVWAADGGFGAINNPISLEITQSKIRVAVNWILLVKTMKDQMFMYPNITLLIPITKKSSPAVI